MQTIFRDFSGLWQTLLCCAGLAVGAAAMAADEAASSPREQASFLQEVVVTAQKRSENIQTVPLSVSAIEADDVVAAE